MGPISVRPVVWVRTVLFFLIITIIIIAGHVLGHPFVRSPSSEFRAFVAKYNKTYRDDAQRRERFAIFQENVSNAKFRRAVDRGTAQYGVTKFSDMTDLEFRLKYLNPALKHGPTRRTPPEPIIGPHPASFDWRHLGAVTAVKDQEDCGSCWAFSAVGNIEGQWFVKQKRLLSLSEQELVDCDKTDLACAGGYPSSAYEAIISLGGLMMEKDYPYKGHEQLACAFSKAKAKAYINGSVDLPSDEDQMATWLVNNGPISIALNAMAMMFYTRGISYPYEVFCLPWDLNHAVLIVGYGVEKGVPFWIIKNSWGVDWGEDGYYRVYRGAGVCGLNLLCTSAVVD